eukprot:3155752-Heterocapsa_arctica.AAC.2
MDWTMGNVRIMDVGDPSQADQEALTSSDGENIEFEMRTEKMDRIVLHSEVPTTRTFLKEANPSPDNLGPLCGDKMQCITCAAKFTTANFRQDTFDVANSSIVDGWVSMKS